MLKKTITYEDYDGNKRTEDFYFNLSKAEILEMEVGIDGSMREKLIRIVNENNPGRIIETFKEILLKAYGVKSGDGKRFIKSKEVLDEFVQTEAYTTLYMQLATDADFAVEFVNGILPKEIVEEMNKPEVKQQVLEAKNPEDRDLGIQD